MGSISVEAFCFRLLRGSRDDDKEVHHATVQLLSSVTHGAAGFAVFQDEFPVQTRRGKHYDTEDLVFGHPTWRQRVGGVVGMLLDHTNAVGGTGEERNNLNLPFSEVGPGKPCSDNGQSMSLVSDVASGGGSRIKGHGYKITRDCCCVGQLYRGKKL